jgi:(p)ppGpp synthase/HD superfamily hydrolase
VIHETKRLIDARWRDNLPIATYPVDIEIYANDRANLLADVLSTLATKNISVTELKAKLITQTMNDVFTMTVHVPDAKVLEDTFALLMGVKGVYSVERVIH